MILLELTGKDGNPVLVNVKKISVVYPLVVSRRDGLGLWVDLPVTAIRLSSPDLELVVLEDYTTIRRLLIGCAKIWVAPQSANNLRKFIEPAVRTEVD